ncbi:hypothetical protein C8R47DRAFT_1080466 [Mycena vitilis]|nr:hypothetical protein C8R47DRAFT_1080466 [Mycena vitilis]
MAGGPKAGTYNRDQGIAAGAGHITICRNIAGNHPARVTIRCVGPRAEGTRTTNEQGAEKPQSERPKKGEEEACTVRGKCEVEAKVVGVGKSVAKQEPGLMKVAEKNEKLNGSQ